MLLCKLCKPLNVASNDIYIYIYIYKAVNILNWDLMVNENVSYWEWWMVIHYVYWEWYEMNINIKCDGIGIVVISSIYYELEVGLLEIKWCYVVSKCEKWCRLVLWLSTMWKINRLALWPSTMRIVMSIGFVTVDKIK